MVAATVRPVTCDNALTTYALQHIFMSMDPKTAVNQLIAAGWTEPRIAEAVATNQATIHRIKTGAHSDCRYKLGVRLVRLAESETVKVTDSTPEQSEAA